MRKCRLLGLLLVCSFVWSASGLSRTERSVSVIVKETQIRTTQSFFGEVLATLSYEDSVQLLGSYREEDAWLMVRSGSGTEGWVHRSALETRRFTFTAGEQDSRLGADTDELALAARGFNQEIETNYKEEQGPNYSAVDRMEESGVELERLFEFIREGGLSLRGGGER